MIILRKPGKRISTVIIADDLTVVSGTTQVFNTTYDYKSHRIQVFYNGQALHTPEDFLETGSNEVTLIYIEPDSTDVLRADYELEALVYPGKDHGHLSGLLDDDHCFSADTELLTKNGFIPYSDIKEIETEALTLNLETNRFEYNMVEGKYVYDMFKELISFKNRYGEILVTPKHTMLYRNTCKPEKNPKSKYLTCTAEEALDKSVFNVPVSAQSDGRTYNKPLDFFRLLGLIISEGSFLDPKTSGYGIRIYQAECQADYIEDVLVGLDVPYTKNKGKTVVFYIRSDWARRNIRTWITEKRISNKLMGLRGKEFRAFLTGLIFGDGSKRSTINISKEDACERLITNFDGQVRYSYHSGDVVLKDQLCHLCTLNGLKAYDYFRDLGWGKGCWTINITNKENVLFSKDKKKRVPYSGNVWCVSVKNKTLVLRRKGFIFIAGNTQYHTDARGDARYYTQPEVDTISGMLQAQIDDKPDNFLELDDTPTFYTGAQEKIVSVNSAGTGLEFVDLGLGVQKNGIQTINNGASSVSINFASAFSSSTYAVTLGLETSDVSPSIYPMVITSKTTAGFTVLFGGEIDTPNFKLNYIAKL